MMNLDAAQQTIRELFAAAIAAVDVRAAVRRAIRVEGGRLVIPEAQFESALDDFGRVVIVAVGKAAAGMAAAAEEALGDRVHGGLALTKYGSAAPTRQVPVREAGHPTPDEAGLAAAVELRDLCGGLTERDLVLCLISGGGSALLTAPADPITLEDLRATTGLLLAAGANINELNTVRKHLETLKGGGLARAAAPARVVALCVSDVLGDPLDVIASGPTVGDSSTFADAWEVIERRGLADRLPATVAARLRAGLRAEVADTPFPDDPCFAAVRTAVIANLPRAAEGAACRAAELGWQTAIGDLRIEGEAREAARRLVVSAEQLAPRTCLIGGGETTVTVRGDGVGGRNTELALAAAIAIDGRADLAVAALATDGDDGASGSAGAVVTGETVARGRALGLDAADYLARNDSATYLRQVGGLLLTGPTQTNVADLYCVLKG
jgi:hydroxypyruvate reductase